MDYIWLQKVLYLIFKPQYCYQLSGDFSSLVRKKSSHIFNIFQQAYL